MYTEPKARINTLVSDTCSVSDEAFAVEIGKKQMMLWIYNNLNKDRPDGKKYPLPKKMLNPIPLTSDYKIPQHYHEVEFKGNNDTNADKELTNKQKNKSEQDEKFSDEEDNNDNNFVTEDAEHEESENEEDAFKMVVDNLDGNTKENQMDITSYYDTFDKYFDMKNGDNETWLSWDYGFQLHVTNNNKKKNDFLMEKKIAYEKKKKPVYRDRRIEKW